LPRQFLRVELEIASPKGSLVLIPTLQERIILFQDQSYPLPKHGTQVADVSGVLQRRPDHGVGPGAGV